MAGLALANNCRRITDLTFDVPPVPSSGGGYLHTFPTLDNGTGTAAGAPPFVVVGDFQRTSFQECLLQREVNDRETSTIIGAIARSKPAFVVVAGDFVFDAGDKQHWRYADSVLQPLAGFPLFPVAGNHDYCTGSLIPYVDDSARCDNSGPARSYDQRFGFAAAGHDEGGGGGGGGGSGGGGSGGGGSGLRVSWHSHVHGELGLVWLDTNFHRLSTAEWDAQLAWLRSTLASWETEARVRGVVLFTHHPAYTNSFVVRAERHVRDDIMPMFCASSKGLAVFAGHAHGLERFALDCREGAAGAATTAPAAFASHPEARHVVVTGGGGGPRPSKGLRKAESRGYEDVLGETDRPRPFNFLRVGVVAAVGRGGWGAAEEEGAAEEGAARADRSAGLRVVAYGLDSGETAARELFAFEVPFA